MQAVRDAGVFSSGEHQHRVSGDLQQRSVIAAGIKAAHIEIPVVAREDQQVRAAELAAAVAVGIGVRDIRSELFREPDDAVRIASAMDGLEPFGLGVPIA